MWFYNEFNTKYVRILQNFSDVISSQIYGHEHTDSYRVLKDPKGITQWKASRKRLKKYFSYMNLSQRS